ncbi:unnamed protein product, partial [Meganyctiphanes norvegica]
MEITKLNIFTKNTVPRTLPLEARINAFTELSLHGYPLKRAAVDCRTHGSAAADGIYILFRMYPEVRQIAINARPHASEYGYRDLLLLKFDFHIIFYNDIMGKIKEYYMVGTCRTGPGRHSNVWALPCSDDLKLNWIFFKAYMMVKGNIPVTLRFLESTNRRPLIWMNLQKPRALVLHPLKGFIIWTDWGANPKIERSFLDGSERQMIISTGLHWPNGITLDYPTETLYWVDAKQHIIEAAKIDGTGRRKVIENNLPHPFAVTVFEDNLYWTDWHTRSIQTANKRTGKDHKDIHTSLAFPMDIRR